MKELESNNTLTIIVDEEESAKRLFFLDNDIRLKILNNVLKDNDISLLYAILKNVTKYVVSKVHHKQYMIPTIIYKYSYLLLSLFIYPKDKKIDSIGLDNPFRAIIESSYQTCEDLYNRYAESDDEICKFFNNPTYVNEKYLDSIREKKIAYELLKYIQVGFFGKETLIQYFIDNYSSRDKLDYVIAKEMAECNSFNDPIVLKIQDKYIKNLIKENKEANYPLLARILYFATLDITKSEFNIGKLVSCIAASMNSKITSHTRFKEISFVDYDNEIIIMRYDNIEESIPFVINGRKYVIDSSGIR